MFPVYLLASRVPETPFLAEHEIVELFNPDLTAFGFEWVYRGSTIMSAGPFGASYFYRFRMVPQKAVDLAHLIEYVEQPRHGFVVAVMRINDGAYGAPSERLPSRLVFDNLECEWLDDLPPPETIPLDSVNNPEHFEMQLRVKECSERLVERVDRLEADNFILRHRLALLEAGEGFNSGIELLGTTNINT